MKFRLLLSAAVLFISVVSLTECGPKETPPTVTPTPTDTTTKPKTFGNKFKIGFDTYNLDIIEDESTCTYFAATDEIVIDVTGISSKASGGVVAGRGRFVIEIVNQGSKKGLYKQADLLPDELTLEVEIGEPPTQSKYSYDTKSNIVVEITEYGAPGGRVKGTFSGLLKSGITSGPVSGGTFDVERSPDK